MSAVPNFEAMEMNQPVWDDRSLEPAPESTEPPKLTPEQCRLAEEHMNVVYGVVGRLQGIIPLERDEMLGDGFEILCKATVSFDPTFGLPFNRYAAALIRQGIINKGRAAGMLGRKGSKSNMPRPPRIVSLMNGTAESLDASPPGPRITPWHEKLIDPDPESAEKVMERFETETETNELLEALTMLSDNELDILVRWLNGERSSSIAALEGVTDSRISQKITDSIRLLRQYYGVEQAVTNPSDALRVAVHKQPNHEICKGTETSRILLELLGMNPRGLSNALTTLERKGLVECDDATTDKSKGTRKRRLRAVYFTPQNNVDDIRKRLDIDEPHINVAPLMAPKTPRPVSQERYETALERAEMALAQAEADKKT